MNLLVLGQDSPYLQHLLHKAGYKDVIVHYFFEHERTKLKYSMAEIREARPTVLKYIAKHPTTTILGLGGLALKFFLDAGSDVNVAKHRGRPVKIVGTKRFAYVTYDPVGVSDGSHDLMITEDLTRFKLKTMPWPNNKFPTGKTLGVDTEYAPDGSILNIALANSSSAIDINLSCKQSLRKVFAVKNVIGHVLGGDLTNMIKLGCKRNDWAKGENIYDSFIIARLVDENRGRGNYTVDALLLAKHNVKGWKHKTEAFSEYDATTWPSDLRTERCRLDAWAGWHVAMDWRKQAEGPIELQTRIACTLERIRLAGAYVDLPAYDAWALAVKKQHKQLNDIVCKLAWHNGMKEFSPTKPNDIRTFFFKKLRLPVEEITTTGKPAVTKSFLARHQHDIPEVKAVLNFRKSDKLLTTYVTGIHDKIVADKQDWKIPFRLGAMGTRTARRASDKPNAQNWPKSARAIICSRWKDGFIVDNDFSKLEIVLLAYEAQDEELMRYFTKEKNGYIAIGTKLFSKTVEEGTAEYRQIKALVLGVNYNLQTYGLARQLWDLHNVRLSHNYETHVEECDKIRQRYLRMFPRIVAYQHERVHEVHKYGSALCWFGQLRRLPIPAQPPRSEGKEAWKRWRKLTAHLENEAINARIQNAASYVCGTAMLDVESALLAEYGFKHVDYHLALAQGRSCDLKIPLLINEVHDSLVFDCPKREVKKAQGIIKECMTKLVTLRKLMPEFNVPIKVSQQASSHWGKVT